MRRKCFKRILRKLINIDLVTVSNRYIIGFFSLDRAAQTEVTEVVDLKEMTEVLQILPWLISKLGAHPGGRPLERLRF